MLRILLALFFPGRFLSWHQLLNIFLKWEWKGKDFALRYELKFLYTYLLLNFVLRFVKNMIITGYDTLLFLLANFISFGWCVVFVCAMITTFYMLKSVDSNVVVLSIVNTQGMHVKAWLTFIRNKAIAHSSPL